MDYVPFSKKDLTAGEALVQQGRVRQVLFSEGTYQVEVLEQKKREPFWPFVQIDDTGHVLDCFCSCKEAEKHKSCPHLGAAYARIFNDTPFPLHVRFRDSLWNLLCQIASRCHGYDSTGLKSKEGEYKAFSTTGKLLFRVKGQSARGKKKLEEILFHRAVETEETSLKFSNLPPEEIALWKQGKPSHALKFELSFWSDLAKWWMSLQEEREEYTLSFDTEPNQLPHWVQVKFASVSFGFYVAEANWPYVIPVLGMVESPLPVFEFHQQKIEAIRYDEALTAFFIESSPLKEQRSLPEDTAQGIHVGDWLYFPERGFFPARIDPLLNQKQISKEKICSFLQKHPYLVQKYLVNAKIHLSSVKAQYDIFFDAEFNLHVICYVYEKGDLQQEGAAFFGSWVYLPNKGFYYLENLLFDGVEKLIVRQQIGDFINRHRAWLNTFEGFQTHVYTIESKLRYEVTPEENLRFDVSFELTEIGQEFIDFGEWVYLKGRGFFAKRGRGASRIHAGLSIEPFDVSSFIHSHQEELESLKGFFSTRSPMYQAKVDLMLDAEKRIVVRPHFIFHPTYTEGQVKIFGDYTYAKGEGFCEIPFEKRLPEEFVRERRISVAEEPYFVLQQIDLLGPFITSLPVELTKPKSLSLRVRRLRQSPRAKAPEWLIEAALESELGSVELYEIWRAVAENKRYLFTPAGLILLKQPRFHWLKNLPKRKWLSDGKKLKLTTLEWLRLSVFEEIRLPEGRGKEEIETRRLLDQLQSFQPEQTIVLTGLKSDLRAYQEIGVKWLWFLYLHGLSGLLCDEMGLGKTHQAMGLISAVKNATDSKAKFLVVCPTSVIYHWEELLKRFLPHVKVSVFYGIARKLPDASEGVEILLTSYGVLRSERKELARVEFDVAIFDEIQSAKNAHSLTHKSLKKIQSKVRIGLTGTPIENRLLELKALFDLVLPTYFPQEAQFKEFFVNPIEKHQDAEKKVLLNRLIKPFILRRKKTEVLLELPEKIEEISYCDLSDEQHEMYRKVFHEHRDPLIQDLSSEGKPVPYMHVFSLLSTLKQICDHPCMITKKFDDFQKHKSGKWDLFVALLQEIRDSGQKLVVFSQYLDMLDMIESYLKEHKIGYAGIRGSTRNRKEQLEKFRDDPQCEVFVASLQAVGVGVDLVSASVVIHYDRWWNPARENQATDRVHRIGQNRGVQVFKMVTKGTIEEHIHNLIERKNALMEGIIGFDEQDRIKGLNRDELLQLLHLINRDLENEERE